MVSAEKSWWGISTGKSFDIIISNPVKVLLSVSLLALFAFVDIGFAIVFLNFLLFNEAFLCINYAIAGLSAGSKRNASLFGLLGLFIYYFLYLILLYAPYIFKTLLDLPQPLYVVGYILFAIIICVYSSPVITPFARRKKELTGLQLLLYFLWWLSSSFPKKKF